MAGTVGHGLQVEALNVKLMSKEDLGLIYSAHVQDYGWMNNSFNGETSGTTGQSKRIEAVMMKLTGSAASKYDIYYRVHSQNIGWLGWAKNGQPSGTAGLSYRVETVQIEVIPKGDEAPSASYGGYNQNDARAFIQKSGSTPSLNTNVSVEYQTNVQDIGWQAGKKDGQLSGTTGRSLRLEGMQIVLVKKGDSAPKASYNGVVSNKDKAFY